MFLEADDAAILRRFSETRRPHPLGADQSVAASIRSERERLAPIRRLADPIINTSKFNVHELRDTIHTAFRGQKVKPEILIQVTSFGFRHGVPTDSDLVFDVRFLPNPNYIAAFKALSGKNPGVARYIRSFPQTIGIHRTHLRSADLSSSALYRRRQIVPDGGFRLYRRAASQRGHRSGDSEAARRSGLSRQGIASRPSEEIDDPSRSLLGDLKIDLTIAIKLLAKPDVHARQRRLRSLPSSAIQWI